MSIDLKNVKKQFEKGMDDYDKNAVVQDLMASKMVIELAKLGVNFENILELGCGTGLLTKRISTELLFENYYANDLVEKSKIYVTRFVPNAKFLCGNALKIKPQRKMDLVVSNAMFQWFDSLDKALISMKSLLKKEGILAFSTFGPDNFKQITEITGLTLQYKTKAEIEKIMIDTGFNVLYCEEFYEELEFKTPLELLAHMKSTGVNSLSEKTWTIKKVKDFCDNFSKKYEKVKVSYAPIIVICKLEG